MTFKKALAEKVELSNEDVITTSGEEGGNTNVCDNAISTGIEQCNNSLATGINNPPTCSRLFTH